MDLAPDIAHGVASPAAQRVTPYGVGGHDPPGKVDPGGQAVVTQGRSDDSRIAAQVELVREVGRFCLSASPGLVGSATTIDRWTRHEACGGIRWRF